MRERLEQILARYGQTVELITQDGRKLSVKAFLQPILRQREDLPVAVTPLGAVSDARWLYIGSSGLPLSPGDQIDFDGLHLMVQESRIVYWMDKALYCWAVLRPRKETAG